MYKFTNRVLRIRLNTNNYTNILTNSYQSKSSDYNESINDAINFWKSRATAVDWFKPPPSSKEDILDSSKAPFYTWYKDSMINMCYNCIDRHVLKGFGNRAAIIYDSPVTDVIEKITYKELLDKVKKFAGVLQDQDIQKGDIVMLYLPNIPEALVAMLSCSRIGATHVVVFGGFASNELAKRIDDVKPKLIITTNVGIDGKKQIAYKPIVDSALDLVNRRHLTKCIVFERKNTTIKASLGKNDVDWNEAMKLSTPVDQCLPVESQHPLYILHTSGSTGLLLLTTYYYYYQ